MSQATAAIANMSRTLFRAAVNAITQAIQSMNSGATEPTETYAYMPWADTTSGWMKQRNAANSGWIPRWPLGTGAAVDIASATTLDLTSNSASSGIIRVTGTTPTTGITLADGQTRILRAAAAWPITHGASLICPGSASYTCAAGDLILAIGEPAGVVRLAIWKADGTAVVASSGGASVNPIINGAFAINQRAAATNADDTYAHDRWNVLTQTGTIALSTLTDVENTTPFMARLTQSQASAQRMGYSQIIEGKNCKHLRGQQVTFRFGRERLSSSANIRIAVLEWTGTEDSVTSDVVLNWTSTTYTAGNFFLAANLTVSGVVQQALTANTLTDGSSVTVTLGSAFNNLIVFAWTESTVAQNVTLDLGKAQIETGAAASTFVVPDYEVELDRCKRYYTRLTPGTNCFFPGCGVANTTSTTETMIALGAPLRTAPSALEQSGTAGDYGLISGVATTCTSVPTFVSASTDAARLVFRTGATLTPGDPYIPRSLAAGGYLGFSAEL
jgi:hypothetical protein